MGTDRKGQRGLVARDTWTHHQLPPGQNMKTEFHIRVAAGVAGHPHKVCPRPGPLGSLARAAVDVVPGAAAAAGTGEQGG